MPCATSYAAARRLALLTITTTTTAATRACARLGILGTIVRRRQHDRRVVRMLY